MASAPLTIPVIHFNDVYRMTRSSTNPGGMRLTDDKGNLHENFDHVINFSKKIYDIQESWATNNREGLLLFSGDLFSPSVESTLTEGRNMVHLMNELAPDACVPGNHEFDFRRERFNQLAESCNFPWVLSNAVEKTKGDKWVTLKYLFPHRVLDVVVDQQKLRIGIVGLMSKDTVSKIDVNASKTFKLLDMQEECMNTANELRTNQDCDLVFALTHALYQEDIDLAKHVNCYTEARFSELGKGKLGDTPGVDLILGGHDHVYFWGKGITIERTIESQPPKKTQGPFDTDDGLLIIKSGTDFEELSEMAITVGNGGSVRKKVVTAVNVIRHCDPGSHDEGPSIASLRKYRMPDVMNRIFKNQTVLGNWIADSMIRWYQNHRTPSMANLPNLIYIMTGGSIRSGSKVDPNKVLQGEIVGLSPFTTTLITIKITGENVWKALEEALRRSNYDPNDPMKHTSAGSFPVVSGIQVEWDSTKPTGERVISVTLASKDPVVRDDKHFYNVLTHTYLAGGGDGLSSLAKHSDEMDTDVPIYKALLQDISDISIQDAKKILESTPAPASKKEQDEAPPNSLIKALAWGMMGVVAVMAIDSLLEDLAKEDRPLLIPEKVMDQAVKITKETKLPVLPIPEKVDGRLKDVAIKESAD